jgi:hypothetical protein
MALVDVCKVLKVKVKLSLCLTKNRTMKSYWGNGLPSCDSQTPCLYAKYFQGFVGKKCVIDLFLLTNVTMGWTTGVQFLAEAGTFSLRHHLQTGSGGHPASCPVGTRGYSPGLKRSELEAHHSPTFSPEVKTWSNTATPPYVFIALCLVKHRDDYTLF